MQVSWSKMIFIRLKDLVTMIGKSSATSKVRKNLEKLRTKTMAKILSLMPGFLS